MPNGHADRIVRCAALSHQDLRSETWQPAAGVDVARLRAAMLEDTRRFFAEREVLMVDTPALSRSAVSDPNIESIGVHLGDSPRQDYFLHTSPEYCMKRMLAAGFPDIGQICRVFRDGESGRRHQPEFTMIEWYRLGFELDDIMQDAEALVARLLNVSIAEKPPRRMSYREAFRQFAGIDPMTADAKALAGLLGAEEDLRGAIGDDRDAWLDLIMATRVTAQFDSTELTTIYHYPESQAALARLCPENPSVADRFEVFFGDLELANGYVELTAADEQQKRFAADQNERRRRGARIRPLDTHFLDSLRAGLPACAGVAAGFDRLLMLNAGADDLRKVQHFPHGSPE